MNRIATYLVFALSFVVFSGVFAQSVRDTVSLNAAEVAVMKVDLDASASIDSLLMHSMPGISVGDYLQRMGYNMLSYGAPGSIQLWRPDGLPPEYAQFLWNGTSINSPGLAQIDLSLVPVFMLYQSGEFKSGNSISSSKNKTNQGNKLNLSWNTNTLENNRFTGLTNYNWKNWNLALNASVGMLNNQFEYQDRLKPLQDAEIQQHNDVRELQLNPSLGFTHKNQSLKLEYWYSYRELELPATLGSYVASDANQKDSIHRISLNWKYQTEKLELGAQSAFIDEFQSYQSNLQSNDVYLIDSEIHARRWVAGIYAASEFLQTDWKISYRPEIWQMRTSNYQSSMTQERREQVSLELHREIAGFEIDINGRLSNAGTVKWIPDYNLTVGRYLLQKEKLKLKSAVSASRIFRWPSFNERYWSPGGNVNIQSEKGYRIEWNNQLTYSLLSHSIEFETSIWNSRIQDRIAWLPEAQVWTAQNIDSYQSKGLKFLLNVWKEKGNHSYFTRVSYANNITQINDEIDMPYAPRHRYSLHAGYQWQSWGINMGTVGSSTRFTDFGMNEITALPSYQSCQVEVSKSLSIEDYLFKLAFQVDNIFNQHYEQVRLRPIPGRVFQTTLSFNFKPKP